MIHYICHSNFIVLLPHISPWTQSWIPAFIVAYQNLTFKSVKQNCCLKQKSVLGCSKVLSGSEKRLHQIDQSECNIFCQNIKLQSELVQRSTFFWLVYLQTSRHATQMNWINTKVHMHMGLSKVKNTAQTCCFIVTNQNAIFRQAKKIHYFYFLHH